LSGGCCDTRAQLVFAGKGDKTVPQLTILPATQLPCSIGIAYCVANKRLPEPGTRARVELQGCGLGKYAVQRDAYDPRGFLQRKPVFRENSTVNEFRVVPVE